MRRWLWTCCLLLWDSFRTPLHPWGGELSRKESNLKHQCEGFKCLVSGWNSTVDADTVLIPQRTLAVPVQNSHSKTRDSQEDCTNANFTNLNLTKVMTLYIEAVTATFILPVFQFNEHFGLRYCIILSEYWWSWPFDLEAQLFQFKVTPGPFKS